MRLVAAPASKVATFIGLALLPAVIHVTLSVGYRADATSGPGASEVDFGLVAASALPHSIVYIGLLAMFGRTLLPGRVALVTALARRMYGAVADEMARYTRAVTWAWCAFFATQLATSLALYLLAPVAIWSFFVNVLNLPLVLLFFVAEHCWRMICLRDAPRHSPSEVIRMIGYIREGFSKRAGPG